LGDLLEEADLRGTKSTEETLSRLMAFAADQPVGSRIVGFGWDDVSFDNKTPHRKLLDTLYPDRPVFLRRLDCHAALLNSAAIKEAGLNDRSPDPEGGMLLREEGMLTGVVVDGALEAVEKKLPKPGRGERKRRILKAAMHIKAEGLSGVTTMGLDSTEAELLAELEEEGSLPLPVEGYLRYPWRNPVSSAKHEYGLFKITGAKFYADGALGSRGAALDGDYSDRPGERGLLLWEKEKLVKALSVSALNGLRPAVHSIGDRALSLVLDAMEESKTARGARIEHVQTARHEQLSRMARLEVTASLQPCHFLDDLGWAYARLGDRIGDAYRLGTVLKAGIPILVGTDFPVSHPSPRLNFRSALYRKDASERISLRELLNGCAPPAGFPTVRSFTCAALDTPPWEEGALGMDETTFHAETATGSGA